MTNELVEAIMAKDVERARAVRYAFRWVASIIMRSGFGPSLASAAKIRSNTPSLLQRMKRL